MNRGKGTTVVDRGMSIGASGHESSKFQVQSSKRQAVSSTLNVEPGRPICPRPERLIPGSLCPKQCMLGSLDDLDFQIADELQNIHLTIDLSFEKLDVSGIGGKLIQYGIDGYPLADPAFPPRMIIKKPAEGEHPHHGLS